MEDIGGQLVQPRARDRSVPLDGSTASWRHGIEWASDLASRTATTLTAIDEARWRLDLGGHGSRQACGTDIPSERLRMRPHARECVPGTAPSDR